MSHCPIQNQIHMGESLSIPTYCKGNMVIDSPKSSDRLAHLMRKSEAESSQSTQMFQKHHIYIQLSKELRGRNTNKLKSS